MATLPDVDTSQVGMIVYYNVIDNTTITEVDPTAILDSSKILSYQQYDNGIRGAADLGLGSDRFATFHVKSDGWISVWVDRSEKYGSDEKSENLYDIVDLYKPVPIDGGVGGFDSTNGAGISIIQSFFSQIDAAADNNGTFNAGDVSWYCYKYPNATTLNMIEENVSYNSRSDIELSYTDTVNNYSVLLGGYGFLSSDNYGTDFRFEGTTYWDSGNNNNYTAWSLIDAWESGIIPSSGVSYTGTTSGGNIRILAVFS